MNQLEYTGSHKKFESEMQLFVYDASDYTEYDDFEISDFKTELTSKQIQSPRLKRNGNYRSDRRLLK
jgi:magnesium transporter